MLAKPISATILRTLTIHSNQTMSSYVPGERVSDDALSAEWEEIRAAQQDPRAFRPLYQRYYEQIFRYIFRRCEEEAEAADICSQVFLKALKQLPKYENRGLPFSAWLYRIASNEISMFYRRQKKQRVVSADTSLFRELADDSVGEGQERQSLEIKEQQLRKLLKTLKPEELSLIEWRFFEQRPFAEIASLLEISEANAKMRTYRLLTKLRKKMPNNA